VEKRGGEVASKEEGAGSQEEERQPFRIGRPSSPLVVVVVVREKKKVSILILPSSSLSLLSEIQIRRWGPIVSDDPLKRRQVVYLSERVSFFVW